MDAFCIRKMVEYSNVDWPHTMFMTVILFREGEREWDHEEENKGALSCILSILFLKKYKYVYFIKLSTEYIGILFLVISILV